MIFFKGKISIESLVNYLNNTTDDSTRGDIEKWISSGHENQIFFSKLKEIWENQEDLSLLLSENRKEDWKKVAEAIRLKERASRKTKAVLFNPWLKRTAAAILLLVFTALGYFAGQRQYDIPLISDNSLFHEIIVPSGEKSEIRLSDGSIVWINAGSTVKFPNAFSENSRDIWLNGEAYFEVAKDKHRPFFVHTSDVDVKVYGTKFNLKAYDDEDIFEATLIEGLVSLETRNILDNQKEEVFLEPNHKAIYLKKKPRVITQEISQAISEPIKPRKILISNPVPVEPAVSWREGRLVFFDETLENIAVILERRYGVIIQMEDKNLRDVRYSGVLKNISIEQALKAIQMGTEFAYEIDENVVTIRKSERKKDKN